MGNTHIVIDATPRNSTDTIWSHETDLNISESDPDHISPRERELAIALLARLPVSQDQYISIRMGHVHTSLDALQGRERESPSPISHRSIGLQYMIGSPSITRSVVDDSRTYHAVGLTYSIQFYIPPHNFLSFEQTVFANFAISQDVQQRYVEAGQLTRLYMPLIPELNRHSFRILEFFPEVGLSLVFGNGPNATASSPLNLGYTLGAGLLLFQAGRSPHVSLTTSARILRGTNDLSQDIAEATLRLAW